MRIHEAAGRRNFQGTFVVSTGASVSSARIAHYCDGRNQFERIESLDGAAAPHVSPQRRGAYPVAAAPSRAGRAARPDELLPGAAAGGDDRIADAYEVRPLGVERVAGHEANVLGIKPRDGLRFGYRLWAEKATGLLLRAEVLGERDQVLESSAFSELVIGVKTQPESVLQPMSRLDGYKVLHPTLVPTRLEAEGWVLRPPVPGFQ